jgi:MFS family permease
MTQFLFSPLARLSVMTALLNVSFLMVYSVSTLYFHEVVGVTAAYIGLIAGVSESLSYVSKFFFGYLSDGLKNRRGFVQAGIMGVGFSRILFAFFPSLMGASIARITERVTNGMQAAPSDAWIGDIASPKNLGKAYGMRRAFGMTGAFVGVILSIVFLRYTSFFVLFISASIPAFLSFLCVPKDIFEKNNTTKQKKSSRSFSWTFLTSFIKDLKKSPPSLWGILLIGGLFALPRTMEVFFPLFALNDFFIDKQWIPALYLVSYASYALCSYPAGLLCDKMPPKHLLCISTWILILFFLCLKMSTTAMHFFLSLVLWGAYLAVQQTLFCALLARYTTKENRGTFFGLFHTVNALMMLLGGTGLGYFIDVSGKSAGTSVIVFLMIWTFFVGCAGIIWFHQKKII